MLCGEWALVRDSDCPLGNMSVYKNSCLLQTVPFAIYALEKSNSSLLWFSAAIYNKMIMMHNFT